MDNNKSTMVVKESFFKKILSKLKNLFKKEEVNTNYYQPETINRKRQFFDDIRVEENSKIVYLKIKLEKGEVRAIDLTDEQIDELQKIYDKEIEKKKEKIKKIKDEE